MKRSDDLPAGLDDIDWPALEHAYGSAEDVPGQLQAVFAWLTTDLPVYAPTTLNLRTHIPTRPVGERPYVELEPTEHPLAVEQRAGITMDRVREIAEAVFHSGSSREQ